MSSLEKFLECKSNAYFHIGHSSGLLRINGKLILFDPCWNYRPFSEYWSLVPDQIDCGHLLDKIDLCIVSHIHDDHYTENILSKLKCPVAIMGGRPDLYKKLSFFGCNVNEFDSNVDYDLGEYEIYFLPSSFNKVDSSVFVYSDEFCFYHGNDNFINKEQIKKAMFIVPYVTIGTIPYAYLNWYPENMLNLTREQKESENDRLSQKLLDHAEMLIKEMEIEYVVPAAANLYYNDAYNSPFNDQGMTPWDFKRISNNSDKIKMLTPGDFIVYPDSLFEGRTEEEYLKEIKLNLEQNKPKHLKAHVLFDQYHIERIKEKINRATFLIPNHEIIFPLDNGSSIVISPEFKTVILDKEKRSDKPYTMIFIEPYQLMQWLDGNITYEQVVATRKFKMLRIPDIYNVEVFQYMLNFL